MVILSAGKDAVRLTHTCIAEKNTLGSSFLEQYPPHSTQQICYMKSVILIIMALFIQHSHANTVVKILHILIHLIKTPIIRKHVTVRVMNLHNI